MRQLIIGILIGLVFGGGLGFAASRYVFIQDSTGVAIDSSNPLPIVNN